LIGLYGFLPPIPEMNAASGSTLTTGTRAVLVGIGIVLPSSSAALRALVAAITSRAVPAGMS